MASGRGRRWQLCHSAAGERVRGGLDGTQVGLPVSPHGFLVIFLPLPQESEGGSFTPC